MPKIRVTRVLHTPKWEQCYVQWEVDIRQNWLNNHRAEPPDSVLLEYVFVVYVGAGTRPLPTTID